MCNNVGLKRLFIWAPGPIELLSGTEKSEVFLVQIINERFPLIHKTLISRFCISFSSRISNIHRAMNVKLPKMFINF